MHCDPTASHYLKVLLDAVFQPQQFVNEIIWHYYNKIQGNIHHFPSNHDTIFWYAKAPGFFFKVIKEKREVPIQQLKRVWDKEKKRLVNEKDERGKVMYQESTERRIDDVWRLAMLQPASKEMLGYPTQKPAALLERIISAACPDGGLILDPFCGCGTTIAAAQKLGCRWIGIDITSAATNLIKQRLRDSYGASIDSAYHVVGEPTSVSEAQQLANTDPYQFQWWALGLVGARPTEQKKGGDKGIDGRLYFHDDVATGATKQVIFSVKAGQVLNPGMVRDLGHVVDREHAAIGVLLTVRAPTAGMSGEAAGAGVYQSPWGTQHPRLQILTVEDLLRGVKINMPQSQDHRTFKKAPKIKKNDRPDYSMLPLNDPVDEPTQDS
ncbi:MAG: site-specific DNA-methyltransferase [Isosphaeraceae bacterium]